MTLQLVDSHCHLNMLAAYPHGMDQVVAKAAKLGVMSMLCVSVDLTKAPEVIELAQTYSNVFASVGVHPTDDDTAIDLEQLTKLAAHPRVVAIGETGLDYYREGDKHAQQQKFGQHIQLAKQLAKPLIVHTRQARKDTLDMLRTAADVGGVLHCFTEDWEMAKAAIDLNFYISFSGIVTFRNAIELQEIARRLPLDRMLIETDAPYLTPVPFRGKPNEPGYTRYVAEFISELRNEPLETIARQTTANFFRLFKHAKL